MRFALRHRTQHMHLKSFVCKKKNTLVLTVVFTNEQKLMSLCAFDSSVYRACKELVLWLVCLIQDAKQ